METSTPTPFLIPDSILDLPPAPAGQLIRFVVQLALDVALDVLGLGPLLGLLGKLIPGFL